MSIENPRDLLRATGDELSGFLDLKLHESELLDYKQDLSGDVTPTLAAMANTEGGTIVVGVEEDSKTKTPLHAKGFEQRDPLGALSSQVFTYLDPALGLQTALIPGDGTRVFLVVVVEPSTTRAVLHREKGLLVRVGDQCVAPNRSAFERLMAREATSTTEANRIRGAVSGRAGHWNGPGGEADRLLVTVAASPVQLLEIPPSDRIDDALASVGSQLMGMTFQPRPEPDRSAAEALFHPEHLPNRISLTRTGELDVRLCAQPPGWAYHGNPDWLLDASQLALDVARCLLVPIAIARAYPDIDTSPAVAAVTFTGWGQKALNFRGLHPSPNRPVEVRLSGAPVFSGTLSQPSDAYAMAREAVRGLSRFYGQRGADQWSETLPQFFRQSGGLTRWLPELLEESAPIQDN
jgi:hypothetical protein